MKRASRSESAGAPPAKKVSKAQALLEEKVAEAVEKATAAAQQAQDAAKKALEDTLQCGVCLSLVFDPVTPACGHNACFECISGVLAASPANPLCPTCRGPIEKLRSKLSVNVGLVKALEVNNGPGYRGQVTTLQFHTLLREDKPTLALECLKKGGVDISKAMRLPSGASKPTLHHALEKDTSDWRNLATALIDMGADLNSGGGALDLSKYSGITFHLLRKGATKCTPVAFHKLSHFGYSHSYVSEEHNTIDKALVEILALLPKPLSKVDSFLKKGLHRCLTCGHGKAALALLEAGIPLKTGLFPVTPPIHLAVSHGLLDVVKKIVLMDPLALSAISSERYTPLHVACIHGHADVALFLIDKKCKGVNKERDGYGKAPSFYAVRWSNMGDKSMGDVWNILKRS